MSASTAAALVPEPRRPAPGGGRRLQAVAVRPARRRRPRLAYALIAVGGALAIAAAQIGLSLAITHDSFVLADLDAQKNELDLQASALQDELAGIGSPQMLAERADALGMVVAGPASYLRLSDASILGSGAGAGWKSTVDPDGPGRVGNVLLEEKSAADAAEDEASAGDEEQSAGSEPQLPPPITDGLPSPTTR